MLVGALGRGEQHPEDGDSERQAHVGRLAPGAEAKDRRDGGGRGGGGHVSDQRESLVPADEKAGLVDAAPAAGIGVRHLGVAEERRLLAEVDEGLHRGRDLYRHVHQLEVVHRPFEDGHELSPWSCPAHGASRHSPPARLTVWVGSGCGVVALPLSPADRLSATSIQAARLVTRQRFA